MFLRAAVFSTLAVVLSLACMLTVHVTADELSSGIVDPALAIQTALAKDSLDGVAANAGLIEQRAASLGAPAAKIVAAAKELKGATKIADARTAFGNLSEAIIAYMDAQKLTLDPKRARIAFCPMVNKPWLQKDGAIQNPYYGTEMPTCGNFKK
jgi:hypothetical protein